VPIWKLNHTLEEATNISKPKPRLMGAKVTFTGPGGATIKTALHDEVPSHGDRMTNESPLFTPV